MRRTSIAPALLTAVTLQLGPPRRVTNFQDAYPMLSPDGSRVLSQSNRTGDWEIYTMRPDGTDLVRLTNSYRRNVTNSSRGKSADLRSFARVDRLIGL